MHSTTANNMAAGSTPQANLVRSAYVRSWCLTWNNPPPNAEDRINEFITNGTLRYCVAGRETAPTTGTRHLQIFAQFVDRKPIKFVRSIFGGAWAEPMTSTPLAAANYCKKGGKFLERGVLEVASGPRAANMARHALAVASAEMALGQQQAPDLARTTPSPSPYNPQHLMHAMEADPEWPVVGAPAATTTVVDGQPGSMPGSVARPISASMPHMDVASAKRAQQDELMARVIHNARIGNFSAIPPSILMQRASAIRAIASGALDDRKPATANKHYAGVWISGPVNAGKTFIAENTFAGFFPKTKDTKWWDGYRFQDYVLIDELQPGDAQNMKGYLKSWCDKSPFYAEVKGGSMLIRPKIICVTSNWSIGDLYPDPIDAAAMRKRYLEVKFTHRGCYTCEDILRAATDTRVMPPPRFPDHNNTGDSQDGAVLLTRQNAFRFTPSQLSGSKRERSFSAASLDTDATRRDEIDIMGTWTEDPLHVTHTAIVPLPTPPQPHPLEAAFARLATPSAHQPHPVPPDDEDDIIVVSSQPACSNEKDLL